MNLHRSQSTEPVEGKDDLTDQVLDWARDRTGALEATSTTSEVKPSKQPKMKASPRIIVVAFQEGENDRGEAHLFEDLEAAGRFIENLLDSGLDPQRLGVFDGTQLDVQLTYRPVVHLKANEPEEDPAA